MRNKLWFCWPLALIGFLSAAWPARADSIWERRNPRFGSLYEDYRARYVGDLLTISFSENTTSRNQERRDLNKDTRDRFEASVSGDSTGNQGGREFFARLIGFGASQRRLDSRANTQIQRQFLDQMTVMVIGVAPNGNLIIEGYRTRLLSQETRTMRARGFVRPQDIGPGNVISSAYIGNLDLSYIGSGQESAYQNSGWWGRFLNRAWPW